MVPEITLCAWMGWTPRFLSRYRSHPHFQTRNDIFIARYWCHLNPLYPPLLPAVEQTRIWQKLASDQVWMLIMAEITNQFKKGNHVQFQSLIDKNTRHIKIPWHREYLWPTWYYDHCRIVNGNVARLRRASGTFVTWSVDDPSLMIWLQVLQGGEAVRNCDQTHIIGLL